jgi:tripartite ATP-independent transporter DctP family solute receptor
MMLKKFRCLALVMALVLIFVSCTTFAAKKPIKLVFGHVWAADHFMCKGDLYLKKIVEKKSKRQIIIDYYPASQLGNAPEQYQATMSGSQQMVLSSPGGLQQFWPKLASFNLPYLYRDDMHIKKVANKLASLLGQPEMAAKTNLRILCVRILPARHLTTKFPVNKLEDIKGIKMRVPQNAVSIALWKVLGVIPIVIPAANLYTSLATGLVDAQENPLNDFYMWKIHEQNKYCALTGHMQELVMTLINNDSWNSLTAAQKKIIRYAAKKSAEMGLKDVKEVEEKYYNLLVKEGMKFTKPNLVPFREKAKTLWEQFGDKELIEKVQLVK